MADRTGTATYNNDAVPSLQAGMCQTKNSKNYSAQEHLGFSMALMLELEQMREKLSISDRKWALAIQRWVMKEKMMQNAINELELRIELEKNDNIQLRRCLEEKSENVRSLTALLENVQTMERKSSAKIKELLKNLRNEKEQRAQLESNLKESSLKHLLFNGVNEDGTNMDEEELRLRQINYENLSVNEEARDRRAPITEGGELLKRTREEFLKQEVCWREAVKAREDLIADLRESYEEQISWKDEEFTYLEHSTQEVLGSKEAELQRFADQVELLLEDKKYYQGALETKDKEIKAMRESLRCDEANEEIKRVCEQAICDKVDEITSLETKVEELLGQQAVLKQEKEAFDREKLELIHQKECEIKGIKDETTKALREKEEELGNVKMRATETAVALQESARKTKQELSKLEKKVEDDALSAEEKLRKQTARHEEEMRQNQQHLKVTMEQSLKAREIEMLDLFERSQQAVEQKEAVIIAMKEFTRETAAKYQSAVRAKDARIADLEESVEQSAKNYSELEEKLADLRTFEDELREESSALKANENYLKETLAALENSLEKAKEEKDTFETLLATARCEFNNEIKEKQHFLQERIAELAEETSKKEESLKEAVALHEEKQKASKELEEKLSICQGELALRESQVLQLESSLRRLEADKNSGEQENRRVVAEMQAMTQIVSERDENAQKYRSHIRAAKKETARLVQSLKTTTEAVEVTKSELEQCRKALDQSTREVEDAKRKSEEAARLQQRLSSQNKVLESRLKGLEKVLDGKQRKIESLGVLLDEEKQHRLAAEHCANELSERLEHEKKQNEVLSSALQNVSEGFDKLQNDSAEVTVLMKDGTSRLEGQIGNFQRVLDDKGKLLLEASRQKESLLQELRNAQDAEQSGARKMAETLLNTLNQDKISLTKRLTSLEVEHRRLLEEKAKLTALLKSSEVKKTCLDSEVSALKELVSGKDGKLAEALGAVEASDKENERLKLQLNYYDAELRCETDNKMEVTRELEQVKAELETETGHFKELLARKEDKSKKVEETLEGLRCENAKLKGHFEGVRKRFENEKKLALRLREEATKLDASNGTLRRDNEVFQSAVKDMELQALKLKTTEDSLLREREMSKELKEQLLDANSQRRSLMMTMKEFQSTNEEVRSKMEFRIQSLQSEADQLSRQCDERNKEFYALREEKTLCEMRRRDTELKVKELENSLRQETSLREAVLRRKQELEQDIQNLRENKNKEVTILKAALDNTVRDVTIQGRHAQLPLKSDVDNHTVQKMCGLYQRISELRDELQEKGTEGLTAQTVLARTQAELTVLRELSKTELDGV